MNNNDTFKAQTNRAQTNRAQTKIMRQTKLIKSLLIIAGYLLSQFVISAQIDPSQIQARCENITPQQRQLASAAGYDLESLCSSASKLVGDNANSKTEKAAIILPRNADYNINDRGVIEESPELELNDQKSEVEIKTEVLENSDDKKELKPYGYDLFAGVPTTFAPSSDIPTPVNYVVGPGDSLEIQLLGKVNKDYSLLVGRNGALNFPELGPINVSGLSFNDVRELIKGKVKEQMIGVRAVISLGEIRSISIFVLGEAFKPGSYTVSSLSTMTNAIFVSGGITEIGSLRNIQLKRQGKVITTLDLYALLQQGDTSKDSRLLPGDVIYIPPVGLTAGIKGEVKRPAIYELKGKQSILDLIKLAGGYSSNAFPNSSSISRKSKNGFTTVLDIDLSKMRAKSEFVLNGDVVEVSTKLDAYDDIVSLTGAFHREKRVKWKKELKLSHLISSAKDFVENADLKIGLIIRKEMPLRNYSILHFDLQALLNGDKSSDITLKPMDEILTFENNDTRLFILEAVNNKLQHQDMKGGLAHLVNITGNVRYPGQYPYTKNMNVRDLVLLAGGLAEASYLGNAEITRHDTSNTEEASIYHLNVNLLEELSTNNATLLTPKDKLSIYVTPDYRENHSITLEGEVRFPGVYEFKRGETLSQVINRAGGFTKMAYLAGVVFTRDDLKKLEEKQLKALQEQMRADIAASQLEDAAAGKGGALKDSEEILAALSETEALGRLVIKMSPIMDGLVDDVRLKDGDFLSVPGYRQEVSVLGEVQHATSHIFTNGWTIEDYLENSGGLTLRADDDRIYVVKADGSVFLPSQTGWLSHQNEMLSPGDTIVVPLDTDRIKSLTLWTNVSQIVYQMALGAAAVKSL